MVGLETRVRVGLEFSQDKLDESGSTLHFGVEIKELFGNFRTEGAREAVEEVQTTQTIGINVLIDGMPIEEVLPGKNIVIGETSMMEEQIVTISRWGVGSDINVFRNHDDFSKIPFANVIVNLGNGGSVVSDIGSQLEIELGGIGNNIEINVGRLEF